MAPVGGQLTRAKAFFILAAFLAVAGLLVSNLGLRGVLDTNSVLANGEVVSATVVEVRQNRDASKRHSDENKTYTPIVSFEVETGATARANLPAVDDPDELPVGETVEIMYDRTSPSNAVITGGTPLLFPYIGLGAGIAALLVAAVLAIRGLRARAPVG